MKNKINKELAYIIGVMISDGYMFKSQRAYFICLKVIDKDFAINFKNKIENQFNKNAEFKIEKNSSCKQGFHYRIRFISKEAFNIIEFHKKDIYKNIFNYPKIIQISFFNGIFDSEGYVSNPIHHKRLGIACNNKKTISLCRKILLKHKINSQIYISIKREKPYYDLYICGRKNIILFKKIISTSIKRKSERIDNLIKSYKFKKIYTFKNKK